MEINNVRSIDVFILHLDYQKSLPSETDIITIHL